MIPPFSFIKGGLPPFDVTTLTAEGLWRGSYSASPWVGTASAGGSGSRDLTEATNPPSAGTAVNGFTPAVFDGSNDQLGNALLSDLMTASAYFWWALFYSTASGGSNAIAAGPNSNPCLWVDSGGWSGCTFRNGTGLEYVQAWHASAPGTWLGNEHAISLNAWNLLCVRYDGTNIRSRLNAGSASVAAAASVGALNGMQVGHYNGSARFTGRLMELGFIAGAESDARFDDVLSSARGRYPAMGL